VNIYATDDFGVTGYCVKIYHSTPSSSDSCWTSVTSTNSFSKSSISISANRYSKTYAYVWFRDAAGNISAVYSDSCQDYNSCG